MACQQWGNVVIIIRTARFSVRSCIVLYSGLVAVMSVWLVGHLTGQLVSVSVQESASEWLSQSIVRAVALVSYLGSMFDC